MTLEPNPPLRRSTRIAEQKIPDETILISDDSLENVLGPLSSKKNPTSKKSIQNSRPTITNLTSKKRNPYSKKKPTSEKSKKELLEELLKPFYELIKEDQLGEGEGTPTNPMNPEKEDMFDQFKTINDTIDKCESIGECIQTMEQIQKFHNQCKEVFKEVDEKDKTHICNRLSIEFMNRMYKIGRREGWIEFTGPSPPEWFIKTIEEKIKESKPEKAFIKRSKTNKARQGSLMKLESLSSQTNKTKAGKRKTQKRRKSHPKI